MNMAAYMAERETDKSREIAAVEREERINHGIYCCRAYSQSEIISEMVADPSDEAAMFYSAVALNWDNEAEIGRIAKRIVENRYRQRAETIDDMRRG